MIFSKFKAFEISRSKKTENLFSLELLEPSTDKSG